MVLCLTKLSLREHKRASENGYSPVLNKRKQVIELSPGDGTT